MNTIDRILEGQLCDEGARVEFHELCEWLRIEPRWALELVAAGILEPHGPSPEAWSFPATALVRARVTERLVHDLGVNLAGAAVILDLVEQRRDLERRLRLLERLLEE